MKIVLLETQRLGEDISLDCLEEFGEVIAYKETNTIKEAVERVKDADIVIVDQFPINEDTIGKAKKLKFVTMTSTGTDFIDFKYTNKAGISVANIKGYSSNSVAQHTFSLLLYLLERMAYFDDYVKSEKYVNDTSNSSFAVKYNELAGKKWGIVGLGKIGLKVASIAAAFGCDVVYHSPSGNPYCKEYIHLEFNDLIETCDVISVHAPLTNKTKDIFGYNEFKRMKKSAYFINVSRGAVVDEAGLAKALSEDLIAGAGLDVLVNEPMTVDCPLKQFKDSKKLVITPHMAWASVESRTRSINEIYLNIKSFINGEDRNICR